MRTVQAVDFYERKAEQLQRDFGVPHPMRQLRASLRARDDREVTPYQAWTCRKRLEELRPAESLDGWKNFQDKLDGAVVMLMRGARIENIAVAMGYRVNRRVNETDELVAEIREYVKSITWWDELIGESQRGLDLWRRI